MYTDVGSLKLPTAVLNVLITNSILRWEMQKCIQFILCVEWVFCSNLYLNGGKWRRRLSNFSDYSAWLSFNRRRCCCATANWSPFIWDLCIFNRCSRNSGEKKWWRRPCRLNQLNSHVRCRINHVTNDNCFRWNACIFWVGKWLAFRKWNNAIAYYDDCMILIIIIIFDVVRAAFVQMERVAASDGE